MVAGSLDSNSFVAHCVTDGDVTGLFAANNPRQFALRQRDLAAQLAPLVVASHASATQGDAP